MRAWVHIEYHIDKYKPTIWYRDIEKIKVGTWFFGLLPKYEYYVSEWRMSDDYTD